MKKEPILSEAYEIISTIIQKAGSDGVLIDRDVIARHLLNSELNSKILMRSKKNNRTHEHPFDTAANFVDWFSAHITSEDKKVEQWKDTLFRARVLAPSISTGKVRSIWAYTERSPDTHGRLIIRYEKDSLLRVGLIGKDTNWSTYSSGVLQLPCGLYTVNYGRWASILKELEDLINSPDCKEKDLQKFFESYPDLLKGEEYKTVIPEAVINREIGEVTAPWEADFVLSPFDQSEFCKIIELKRPQLPTVKKKSVNHSNFYVGLRDALDQIRDYYNAFNSKYTQDKFKDRYGVDVYRPNLQLIIGRQWNDNDKRKMLDLQRDRNIQISSWDSILERFKRSYT